MTVRRLVKIAKWTALTLFVLSMLTWAYGARTLPNRSPFEDSLVISWIPGWDVDATIARRRAWPEIIDFHGCPIVFIPLWMLVCCAGLATAVMLYADRRHVPPGHCRCGYNLTGNISGVCPECGTPTGART